MGWDFGVTIYPPERALGHSPLPLPPIYNQLGAWVAPIRSNVEMVALGGTRGWGYGW